MLQSLLKSARQRLAFQAAGTAASRSSSSCSDTVTATAMSTLPPSSSAAVSMARGALGAARAGGQGMLRLPSYSPLADSETAVFNNSSRRSSSSSSSSSSYPLGDSVPLRNNAIASGGSTRRTAIRIGLLSLAAITIVFGFFGTSSVQNLALAAGTGSQPILSYVASKFGSISSSSQAPFFPLSSASDMPPSLSSLPPTLRRMTLISYWSSDNRPQYLNNFFRSAALNADVADLLFFHITSDKSQCMDGRHSDMVDDGIDRNGPAWDWENGGNIKVVCMSREAAIAEKAAWLCSKERGWDCDEPTYAAVLRRMQERTDNINVDWKPMLGEIHQQYFIHPENPFWAWADTDIHIGNLRHIPFSLLSTVNILAPTTFSPRLLFLPGQMCFFNLAAPGSIGAWKNYKPLQTPEAFCDPADGVHGGYAGDRGVDESFLSAMMLRDEPGYAGHGLNWAFVSDLHGEPLLLSNLRSGLAG